MLIVNKRPFYTGLVMAFGFAAVLVLFFMPVLDGRTPLQSADDLFNSVSKDSSYYIPALREHAEAHRNDRLDMRLTMPDAEAASQAAAVLTASGAEATATGAVVAVKGSLGQLLGAALDDADVAFKNSKEARGLGARVTMFAWWNTLKQVYKQLRLTSRFEQASAVEEVVSKGVEVSYNFYGIMPRPVAANVLILTASLIFYLIYTMWWGYSILWLCEGIGLQMKSAHKREH
jgi:hypothetical protein